jgi:hypothetical protein
LGWTRKLLIAGWSDTYALDLTGLSFLDGMLAHDEYQVWSKDRSPQDNNDYLLAEFKRRKVVDGARASGSRDADGNDGGGSSATTRTASTAEGAQLLAELDNTLTKHFEGSGTLMNAIELVMHSGAVPAMKYVLGHGVTVAHLTGVFDAHCRHMPAKLREYIVDTLKHNDQGELDTDLEDLTVSSFYLDDKGSHKRDAFYNALINGRYTSILWDKWLVSIIAKMLDPNAVAYDDMIDVYADPVRLEMHVTYVGRLLHGLGKLQDDEMSLAAIVADWQPILTRATQRGPGLRQDTLREINTLMNAVWSDAESNVVASFTHGIPWQKGLCSDDISAYVVWSNYTKEFDEFARHSKRFKRSFAVRLLT